jgi:hypothetical protein
MLQEGLNLANALFRIQMPKCRASETCRSVQDEPLGISVETAFGKDCTHCFGLDTLELFAGKVAVR